MLSVPGMGHDLPRAIWTQLIDAIGANAARAGGSPERHPPLLAPGTSLSGLSG